MKAYKDLLQRQVRCGKKHLYGRSMNKIIRRVCAQGRFRSTPLRNVDGGQECPHNVSDLSLTNDAIFAIFRLAHFEVGYLDRTVLLVTIAMPAFSNASMIRSLTASLPFESSRGAKNTPLRF